jgi:DNA anti-recombination protein RmuC
MSTIVLDTLRAKVNEVTTEKDYAQKEVDKRQQELDQAVEALNQIEEELKDLDDALTRETAVHFIASGPPIPESDIPF